jgi:hypothetical protein
MHRSIAVVCALIGLVACASTPEAEPNPEAPPDWLAELRAREAELPAAQTLLPADLSFRVAVPAKPVGSIETQAEAEAYRLSLDIGTTAPIDCWIYPDSVDLATSLAALSESTFGAIGEIFGEVEARHIDRVDAGAIGGHPFLALDWMYRVRTEQGAQVGQVKHLVARKGVHGLYCQQNEVGYAKSFRRVVGAMLASLEFRDGSTPPPRFSEVSTMSIRGMQVGVVHTTLSLDAEGDARVDSLTSVLVPVTADALQSSDTYEVEFARPDGRLINHVHVETQNGELTTHLELNPDANGAWSVEGTFQGKPLSARIESPRRVSSWLGDALALRHTLATGGSGAEVTMTRWIPEADPTRLVDGTISIGKQIAPERYAAKLDAAGIEADLVVDRAGTIASASMDMGVADVDVERVYVRGAF